MPRHPTPLFLASRALLEGVEFAAASHPGRSVFTVTCLMTDGEDTAGGASAADVKVVVDRMLAAGRHIVAGIGVANGHTDFRAVFRAMGIPDQWILELASDYEAIVKGMRGFGTAASTAVDAGTFAQTMAFGLGGTAQPPSAGAGIRPVGVAPATGASPTWGTPGGFRPADFSLRFSGSEWEESAAWPTRWDVTGRVWTITPPTPGTWLIIGRGRQADWDQATWDALAGITASFSAQGLSGGIVFFPLEESEPKKRVARVHALIAPEASGGFTVTASRGNVDLPMSDYSVHLTAHQNDNHVVSPGQTIQLARESRSRQLPGIVIRLG